MNRRSWTVLRAIALTSAVLLTGILLGGCQLAIEGLGGIEADPAAMGDQLRGFYITFSRLPYDPVKAPDANRIYAVEKEADVEEKTRFEFEGIEGIPFFLAAVPVKGSDESCLVTICDNHISDVHMNIGNDMELTGRLYLSPGFSGRLYFYPVFQKQDGRIYLDLARGEAVGASNADSARYAFEARTTITEGSNKQEISSKAEVIIEYLNLLDRVVFKEMNSLDEVVAVTEVTKGQTPEAVYLKEDTAYILVEEHGTDYKGEMAIVRSLLERDALNRDIRFLCRFMDDKGIAEGYEVRLIH
ncbi:MAG TPA: hypothetical protein PK830_05935 [Candidatus Atribacteria bacterium]|nr:hypothetical protein [Candidatus Atribacteria bacterium]